MFTSAFFIAVVARASIAPIDEIRFALESYVAATTRFDVPALDRVLDSEYMEVSPLGEVDDRSMVLGYYRVPKDKRGPTVTSAKINELTVRFAGKDVAIAIFREDLKLASSTRNLEMSFRVTTVLRRDHRDWHLLSNHVNGIRPNPNPPTASSQA